MGNANKLLRYQKAKKKKKNRSSETFLELRGNFEKLFDMYSCKRFEQK